MSRISQFFCTLFQFIDMSKCNRYNQSKKGGFYMHFTFKEITFKMTFLNQRRHSRSQRKNKNRFYVKISPFKCSMK